MSNRDKAVRSLRATGEHKGDDGLLGLPPSHPLVLDLDRCLINSDLLFEGFVVAVKANVLVIFSCLYWLVTGGKAHLKRRLAGIALPDLGLIPANAQLVAIAEREAGAGRTVVLATASDELLASRFRRRFPFLSRVISSDGKRNLKGARKAEVLTREYPAGFIYAGDSKADLAVWEKAQGIITVGARPSVKRKARAFGKPTLDIASVSTRRSIFKAIRLQQWVKNALVFAPVPLAGLLGDWNAWTHAFLAFVSIGFLASATYLINDLLDLADDRRHWSKKNRPLAAGRMPIATALALVPVLLALSALTAIPLGFAGIGVIALYGATTLLYSLWLKRVPIVDVFTLACLFTLRLLLGVAAIGAAISPWLFVFSMALFFSMSLAKRHVEVVRMKDHGIERAVGRGYVPRDEPFLLALGVGSALSSVVLLSLYLTADAFNAGYYSAPQFLWFAPVIILLWLSRIWLLSQRGELDDDPVAFAVRDRPSLVLGAVLGLAFACAAMGGNLAWPL